MTTGNGNRSRVAALVVFALVALMFATGTARAADQIYFPAVTDCVALIVNRINAETVRIDVSAWYLTEHAISQALVARHNAGVQVRVIGDRASIFEIDPATKTEFYYLANAGVPIRLRYNPTWYPEIDHMKMAYFKGQGVAEFGSANWATYELKPASSTNYSDETVMFTDDPVLAGALATRFDTIWNDTTNEPESVYGGPPYLKNWYDACSSESACSDFRTVYPNPAPMSINTGRLEPNNPTPSEMIWGQGPDFNNRLITEINNEFTKVRFVIYRLTVSNIASAVIAKYKSGVPVQLIIEPNEYVNRKWPEFWLTHANLDSMWAAGIPIKQRAHTGLTHMKMLVTSSYATNASSNYAAAWQRDNDYFVPATGKPAIYSAMLNRFDTMWNDTAGFTTFVPRPPDTPTQASPSNGAGSVSQTPTLTWNAAVFATSYDVYLGTSTSNMSVVGNVPAQLNNNPPSTYSWTPSSALTGGTTWYWKVVARTNATVRNAALVGTSATWSFTTGGSGGTPLPPPGSSVPSPWATSDIGSVGVAGSANYSNGVFTIAGAGSDIWGTSDSFRYVYQSVTGDVTIVARVASETNTSVNAKAGVMLRESLGSNAANVILDVSPTGNIEFMARSSTGGSTSWLAGASQAFPAWLKLVRSGSTITGYVSGNGSSWTTVGTTTVAMATTYIGLPVTSHNTSALNTSTLDNVSVTSGGSPPPPPPPSSLPSPWQNGDVGAVGLSGSASYSSGVFTVSGAGSDIWGTNDSFQFVNQALSGDGQIVARVTSETNTSTFAKAGVMLRAGTGSNAANVILDVSPSGNVEFMVRSSSGGSTAWLAGATQAFPAWLWLVRSGTTVTGYVSADGSTWTTVGSTALSMSSSALIGMAVTSHNTSLLNTSTFDNVTVSASATPPPPSLPSPWANADVGSVGQTGSTTYASASGGFTVSGAGADIWGTSDAFQFAFKPIAGDGQLIARLTSERNTNTFAKAGLMLRESTAANAANVILDVTPSGNVEFMVRSSTGASTLWLAGTAQSFPAWLKLVRAGTTVTGYVSADGATWTVVGTTTFSIGTNAYVGMAVCSHDTSTLNSATFDNVQ